MQHPYQAIVVLPHMLQIVFTGKCYFFFMQNPCQVIVVLESMLV